MKKVLSLGVLGFLLSSGIALSQGVPDMGGGIMQGAQDAAAAAAKESSELLGGTAPAQTAPVPAVTAEAEPAPQPVVEAVPGESAPVVLAPGTLTQGSLDSSIISQASKIGEEVLILQNRQRFFDQIKTTVDMIGVENTLRMYPEYAAYLDTSPMALQSQLSRVQTLNQLREEVAKANGPTQYELDRQKAEMEASGSAAGTQTDLMSMSIDDNVPPAEVIPEEPAEPALTREDVAALIEEARSREQEENQAVEDTQPDTPVYALMLSEVYGANGQMVAVVTDGTSTYKLRTGDNIPNIGPVTQIERDAVTVRVDDEDHVIRFQ